MRTEENGRPLPFVVIGSRFPSGGAHVFGALEEHGHGGRRVLLEVRRPASVAGRDGHRLTAGFALPHGHTCSRIAVFFLGFPLQKTALCGSAIKKTASHPVVIISLITISNILGDE